MPRTITFGSGAPLLAETADGTSHVAITGRKRDVVEALPALVGGQLPKPSLAVLTKMVAAASVSSFGGGAVTFTAPLSSGLWWRAKTRLCPARCTTPTVAALPALPAAPRESSGVAWVWLAALCLCPARARRPPVLWR